MLLKCRSIQDNFCAKISSQLAKYCPSYDIMCQMALFAVKGLSKDSAVMETIASLWQHSASGILTESAEFVLEVAKQHGEFLCAIAFRVILSVRVSY